MLDYRGATVEDLQLSPALVLPVSTDVATALQLAYERDFSILPLAAPSSRQLIGWLSVDALKPLAEQGKIDLDAPLSSLDGAGAVNGATEGEGQSPVRRFARSRKYEVITPFTPLEDLDAFFAAQDQQPSADRFALVTDAARKFVLGIVTQEDLAKFTARRFPTPTSPFSNSISLPSSAPAPLAA
ncbi:hypothetical protein JCM1841_006494 [Sporobolomyces salmonicolor]